MSSRLAHRITEADPWTDEQRAAIARRQGDLLLDASAGSGKTSVLVERFVQAVLVDGLEVGEILTITFTEKAAAEMRDRIRSRLRQLGADEAARATEGAFISTIHGFCGRILRTHALAAGLDPAFRVLDEPDAIRVADGAFDDALADLAVNAPGGVDLIAAYTPGGLRETILSTYAELRSRGEVHPQLPALPPPPDLEASRVLLEDAARAVARELGAVQAPTARVLQALERLERCSAVIAAASPWPGELDEIGLPGGNGAALTTPACVAYAEALASFRGACGHARAVGVHALLDRLLRGFAERYAQRKRACSGLDFEDLELMTRELLRSEPELRERYRERFAMVMVDELQDTNKVQLELIESIASRNLFTVGDAQQSIYAFRHADVELFEQRGERLAASGARATLSTNFRSRREILDVLNSAFASELGEHFKPLCAGREDPAAEDPRVELLVADKGADWASEGVASPWRVAEACALARRVRDLLEAGTPAGHVVVLMRATTDMRAYERALEERGIPTYVIGGRGYWSHPQVVDLVSYLSALANPREEEALYTVLASPLVSLSLDAIVVLAAAGRAAARDPWWVLRDPQGRLDELEALDQDKLAEFTRWFADERRAAVRVGVARLIERALEHTGYDLAVLAMPGGQRRMANIRKLMRLAREHEALAGADLRGFLEVIGERRRGDSRESEAPVEGEALDAVRLMTIHRAKGLEFEVVCVADLGRGPRWGAPVLRVGRDGRLGLRLSEPGTGKREPALEYKALTEDQAAADAREERRLFYVAMTRARERLILSGAARLEAWGGGNGSGGGPISWIGPAMERAGVVPVFVSPEDGAGCGPAVAPPPVAAASAPPASPPARVDLPPPARADVDLPPPVARLSYSSLGEYRRCGYRFYAERVLRLPPVEGRRGPRLAQAPSGGALDAAERGILVHALLERLDFRRPTLPNEAAIAAACERSGIGGQPTPEEVEDVKRLIETFTTSELCARLGRAAGVRREERFAFLLDGALVEGVLDVLAWEPGGAAVVVDYKTDRLEGAAPAGVVERAYATQRLVYALALLRAGAERVEIVHTFLDAEQAKGTVTAAFTSADAARLQAELSAIASGVLGGEFTVTDAPHRDICAGCPAEGGLCSWPLEMTRRDAPDRLF